MKEELINEFDIEHKENVAYSQAYVDNLKSQLKVKEDLLKEICEEVAEYVATDGEIFQTSKENIYEILFKGENK